MIEMDLVLEGPVYGCRPPCAVDSTGIQPAQGGCDSSGWAECMKNELGSDMQEGWLFREIAKSVKKDMEFKVREWEDKG